VARCHRAVDPLPLPELIIVGTVAIPPVAHFVFGLMEQTEPFHLVHFLAIESCRRVLQPETIYFHYHRLPYGVYWDLIRPYVTPVRVDLVSEVLEGPVNERLVPARYRYAHHADFIRLDALIERGGVYADIDTLFLRSFPPELFDNSFVIGREQPVRDEHTGVSRPSLCNALLMAEPRAPFAVAWRAEMAAALNGTWSNHSGFLAEALTRRMPQAVHIEPSQSFFPFGSDREGIASILERRADTEGALSIHLWSHLWWDARRRDYSGVHAGVLTEEHVRTVDTTYNLLARPFLPELDLW
jgi:hypothetical protein